ncbi:hypothetical protein [Borreliella garinii]|uniref:hypothetical protein n=1 Tax=Borreliella garinii TaxID=29519 RepID=UPI00018ACF85|nr:hypothetical protein [Borreliella garinii]ACL35226.1 conserved hypothetical protein [Borreliella garinii Far04]WNZ67152.1 hypothetical protein PT139_04935 [Borreliella garinii]WNZ68151.1 hypothetical protein PT135_04945 [Borreliella garinii]WNZ69149.1 hypothetical protein PT138_04955 [Borreliella garinii]WNZ70149.1 hypothetical protein PT140_04930 [Borreliella garinii]
MIHIGMGVLGAGHSKKHSQALPDLKKLNLEEDYTKLSKMLKNDAPVYKDNNTLENAITKYKEAIIKAIEVESQIKIKTENNGEDKKNESLTHLRTVIGVLPVIKKTTETVCLACADVFVAVAASLSCSEFSQAVEDFSAAAKEYANGKKRK